MLKFVLQCLCELYRSDRLAEFRCNDSEQLPPTMGYKWSTSRNRLAPENNQQSQRISEMIFRQIQRRHSTAISPRACRSFIRHSVAYQTSADRPFRLSNKATMKNIPEHSCLKTFLIKHFLNSIIFIFAAYLSSDRVAATPARSSLW